MMCVSSFCEHCKRIISTNKYARFDRRVTQRTQYSRPACRAHTIARPPHKHIQVQIRMARTPPPSVSRTCPSASQHARLTSLAALCKLARSARAGPWSVQHSTPPRRIPLALRNEAPPSLLLPAAGRARLHVLSLGTKEVPPALGPLPQPPEQPCSLSAVQLRACANGGDKSSIFAARMAGRASGGRARIPSCGA
jgi:hypothetical protein